MWSLSNWYVWILLELYGRYLFRCVEGYFERSVDGYFEGFVEGYFERCMYVVIFVRCVEWILWCVEGYFERFVEGYFGGKFWMVWSMFQNMAVSLILKLLKLLNKHVESFYQAWLDKLTNRFICSSVRWHVQRAWLLSIRSTSKNALIMSMGRHLFQVDFKNHWLKSVGIVMMCFVIIVCEVFRNCCDKKTPCTLIAKNY